jgi:hypothetical protein
MTYPVMNTSVPWSLVKSGFHKTPHFNSLVQTPAAGRGRSSLALQPYATWDFDLDLNLVLGGESVQYSVLSQFLGCFLACCGRGGFFLFTDPNDNTVDDTGLSTPQSCMLNVTPAASNPMGTVGDGVSTQFQLARQIDQGVDILQQVSGVMAFVNGVPRVDGSGVPLFSVSTTGVLTFQAAPPNNAVITWSGSFQYLCQFTDDTLKDLARVSKNSSGWLWSCGSVAFESVFA